MDLVHALSLDYMIFTTKVAEGFRSYISLCVEALFFRG